jgi:hypothetical protein
VPFHSTSTIRLAGPLEATNQSRLYFQMSGPHGGQTTVIFDGNEKEHHELADLRDKLAHKFPLGCWEASPTSKTSVAHRVVLAARHQ